VIKVIERVATAREAASGETFDRVVHLLTARRQVELAGSGTMPAR